MLVTTPLSAAFISILFRMFPLWKSSPYLAGYDRHRMYAQINVDCFVCFYYDKEHAELPMAQAGFEPDLCIYIIITRRFLKLPNMSEIGMSCHSARSCALTCPPLAPLCRCLFPESTSLSSFSVQAFTYVFFLCFCQVFPVPILCFILGPDK